MLNKIQILTAKFKSLEIKKKIIVILTPVLLVLVLIFIIETDATDSLDFSEKEISSLKSSIAELQKRLEKSIYKYRELKRKYDMAVDAWREFCLEDFWETGEKHNMQAVMGNRIDAAVSASGIKLNSRGNFATSPVNSDVDVVSLSIDCSGSMEAITRFIYQISIMNPKIYWNSASMRSENSEDKKKEVYLSCDIKFLLVKEKTATEFYEATKL